MTHSSRARVRRRCAVEAAGLNQRSLSLDVGVLPLRVYALGIRGKRVIAWNKIIWIVSHRAHANQRFDFGKKENRGRIRCEWYEDRMVTRALFSIIPSFPFFLFLLTECIHGRDRYWEFDLTSVKIDEDKFEDRTASSELWYLDILNFELLRKFW